MTKISFILNIVYYHIGSGILNMRPVNLLKVKIVVI